jgi:hypothetical protein
VLANVTELARQGVVHMYHDYAEADVNRLLSDDYLDPISGYPGFKSALCKVTKSASGKGVGPKAPIVAGGQEVKP